MALFGKKSPKPGKSGATPMEAGADPGLPALDPALLRRNHITLLTIDERWTSLFTGQTLPPSLAALQSTMNEALKKEARLNEELDSLEPTKKKAMNTIIRLTKEAFEEGDEKAKGALKKSRDEIEKINLRWSQLMEERDGMSDVLRDLNMQVLRETARHVFATMQVAQTRVPRLDDELRELEGKLEQLRRERAALALDWSVLSEPFTKLYGTEYVQQLETRFAQEIQVSRTWQSPPVAPKPGPADAGAAKTAQTELTGNQPAASDASVSRPTSSDTAVSKPEASDAAAPNTAHTAVAAEPAGVSDKRKSTEVKP